MGVRIAAARIGHQVSRRHWSLLLVVVSGLAIRLVVAHAYGPALLWTDGWSYLNTAYSHVPVGVGSTEPSGYPLFIRIVTIPARSLALITSVQHLLGVLTATLVYALARVLGVRRSLAGAAAAAAALEAYALRLEQTISSEPLFALLVALSIVVIVRGWHRTHSVVLSGLLLAAAALVRGEGLFVVPLWLLYVLWRRRDARAFSYGLVSVLAPLLLYSAAHAAVGDGFGLTSDEGWLLYGRVAEISTPCAALGVSGARTALCTQPPPGSHRPVNTTAAQEQIVIDWYVWNSESPARRLYGSSDLRGNRELLAFSLKVIEHRPVQYLRIVGRGISDYLLPGRANVTREIRFPSRSEPAPRTAFTDKVRRSYFPTYRQVVRSPSSFVRRYASVFHMREWLLLALLGVCLAGVALPGVRSASATVPAAEILLLAGIPLVVIIGSAAIDGPLFRVVVPTLPLLFAGGAVALETLVRFVRAR